MLNLVAFNPEDDRELLKSSYDLIRQKDSLEIVTNSGEQNTILLKVKSALTVPDSATIRFQNLFKLIFPNGQFYIAQCLFNYGFSASPATRRFNEHKYAFQIVGVADIKVDLGKTVMRPETRTDKIVGRFFGNDIDLDGTKKFNDKYYLVSDQPEIVTTYFDKDFVNTISKYDNILLTIQGKEMFITFDTEFEADHSKIVEDIFSNCKFII